MAAKVIVLFVVIVCCKICLSVGERGDASFDYVIYILVSPLLVLI